MKLKQTGSNQTTLTLATGTVIFFSYETPVAAFVPDMGYLRTSYKWGPTTSRHIKNFIRENESFLVSQEFLDKLAEEVG